MSVARPPGERYLNIFRKEVEVNGRDPSDVWVNAGHYVRNGTVGRAEAEAVLGPEPPREELAARAAVKATVKAPAPSAPPPRPAPCRHLGGEVRQQQCVSCGGHIMLRVFACAVYGETTTGKRVDGVRGCCVGCAAYEPSPPPEGV